MTEYDERMHALELERLRPAPPPPGVPDLLRQLVAALHQLYTTDPDE